MKKFPLIIFLLGLLLFLQPSCSNKEDIPEPDNHLGELYESVIAYHDIKQVSAFTEAGSNRGNTYWDFPSPNHIRIGNLSGNTFYGSTYNLDKVVRHTIWSQGELLLYFY